MHFSRFTERQIAAYGATEAAFATKCLASTGVKLEFVSDTDFVAFDAAFAPGTSQKKGTIDLLVDGVITEWTRVDVNTEAHIHYTLPEGEHHIVIYLPWSVETVLQNIEISDNATLQPVQKKLRILAIGDSITQGYISKHPSITYVQIFGEALNAEVLNQGIGGYEFFKQSIEDAPDWKPDIITLAYGTNDFSHNDSRAVYEQHVTEYLALLTAKYPNVPILGITPLYRADQKLKDRLADKDYTFTEAIDYLKAEYAKYPQATVLDGFGCTPHTADFYAPDYLHPNDIGFTFYGHAVAEALKKMIG